MTQFSLTFDWVSGFGHIHAGVRSVEVAENDDVCQRVHSVPFSLTFDWVGGFGRLKHPTRPSEGFPVDCTRPRWCPQPPSG